MSARYRKDLPDVLKSITCKIQPGEKVGIVGRTGAGKSTIINTLLKITYVSSGNVKIDGRNINEYNLKDLRHSITMIDQEPTLIKSTFKENLDITNQYTNEDLENILRECNLLEIINEKGGLDAMVSNSSLSAG
jgi:ABC-type multidrug transport system fused ATPase/permease subunit